MPIKKRGGGLVKVTSPKPKKTKPVKTKTKTPTVKDSKCTAPKVEKPKRNLARLKSRKPLSSDYVWTEDGRLVIKTPKSTTRWDHKFRMRIIADYLQPKTMKSCNEYERRFLDNGLQDQVYKVEGHRVMVKQPIEPIENSAYVVVLRTDVYDLTTGRKLYLVHDDPAMRVLMVYEFLHQQEIGGVPRLRIAPIDVEW